MPTIPVYLGANRKIYGWGHASSCAVMEFLMKLEAEGNRDGAVLWKLIKEAADNQPSRNSEKCHQLKGKECQKLYEFKGGGSRMVWFYGRSGDIILIHGVKKPKNNAAVVREQCVPAQSIRMQYIQENNP
jgi:hypothetical protein